MRQKISINDIKTFPIKGPWTTKSGGNLDVLSALDYKLLTRFFSYNSQELAVSDEDIRGLRTYRVSNLRKSACGANEWHRIKQELVVVTKGRVQWTFKDKLGRKREIVLSPNGGPILIPPFVLHTYTSLEEGSEIIVITNTLFNPNNPKTFDTYPVDTF